jgi:hypothetical protein
MLKELKGDHNATRQNRPYVTTRDEADPTAMRLRTWVNSELRQDANTGDVDICTEVLDVPRRTVLVEFTVRASGEILRYGQWVNDWRPAEASG